MKRLVLLAFVALMATGCITQKKCNEKYPPIIIDREVIKHDTLKVKEVSHDTTFIIKAGKDTTIYKTDTVNVKAGVVNSNKVITEGKYATATGQVVNSKLIVKLEERSYDLEVRLKDAIKSKEIYKTYYETTKTKEAITKKVKVGKFYVWYFYISLIVLLGVLGWKNRGLIIKLIKPI